jgi:penicillin-binding protein 1A
MFLKPGQPKKSKSRERREPTLRRTAAGRPPTRKATRAPKKARRGVWLKRLVVWGGSAAIWALVLLGGLVAWYAYDLPDVDAMASVARQPSVTLMAADGTLLASYGEIHGARVSVAELPPHLPLAVLAVEDRRFYQHYGVDFRGLLRASLANLRAGRIVQGGSTITQQLAKNLFLTPERTLRRKIQELLLALWLERKFTKDQILGLYLNRVYLGAGTYGVDAAARRYFDKPAAQVNLYEAALLAGLLKAPSRYSPARHKDRAARRTELVLGTMVEAGFITAGEAGQARSETTRGRAAAGAQARYFTDWVLAQVSAYIGPADRDLTVITTLNPTYQRIAEAELAALLDGEGRDRRVGQGALVMMDPGGAVRAMVGGRSYDASQFNRATQALRQPGSAFKPFVYLAGLEGGLRPDDKLDDAKVSVGDWSPRNYGRKYLGRVTLREAFARSLNSVAVRISERAGRDRVVAAARRLGITSKLAGHPSIALGASEVTLLELTGAYATFANQGRGAWPYGILEVRGPEGEVLYTRAGGGPGRLVDPRAVEDMADLMAATVTWGSGKAANPGRPAAGKTGTSQDFRDAWFVGYTAEVVAGVWLGNDDGAAMDRVSGGSLPAALWGRVVAQALQAAPPRPLPGGGTDPDQAGGADEGVGGLIARVLRALGQGDPAKPRPGGDTPVRRERD